ncbi:hypothetical protein Y032_0046g1322 [Ancylostoma ceylanicum]|uniref:Uncharacterized protein n=1 Tax=Ancylostoma ceylanicum TaxID=53326 RepID=A0A016UCF8_9BILA|nr:hypothetical protein Y032_0046g1322 [Ancylostoma ceylanicum]
MFPLARIYRMSKFTHLEKIEKNPPMRRPARGVELYVTAAKPHWLPDVSYSGAALFDCPQLIDMHQNRGGEVHMYQREGKGARPSDSDWRIRAIRQAHLLQLERRRMVYLCLAPK